MSRTHRIAVVGGGPAGLLAAGAAAETGARVALLERGPRPGRKLRLTGKGRCNLTNTADVHAFVRAFAPNGRFLYGPFSRFFRDDLLALLRRLGVETKVERGGRIFPASDSAVEVSLALERWVAELGVDVRTNSRVRGLVVADGAVTAIDLYHGRIDVGAAVIATGGLSYSATGSTGDGYAMAEGVGHTIVAQRAALAPLIVREPWVGELSGLALRNVEARIVHEAPGSGPRAVASEFGEMLFTHQGVSGPIILTLSRKVGALLGAGIVRIAIDLKPALDRETLRARLMREFTGPGRLRSVMRRLVPASLADIVLERAEIAPDKSPSQTTAVERERLLDTLKGLSITVTGLAPIEEAIVTAGGVALGQVDSRSMESRLVRGLYFAGEVLDIDAETGGFNLQAAFSTGWVAGKSAAQQQAAAAAD